MLNYSPKPPQQGTWDLWVLNADSSSQRHTSPLCHAAFLRSVVPPVPVMTRDPEASPLAWFTPGPTFIHEHPTYGSWLEVCEHEQHKHENNS